MNKDFMGKFETFLAGCQKVYDDYMDETFPTNPRVRLVPAFGRKNVKINRHRIVDGEVEKRPESVHLFVDMTNGDVLKAASFKAPAKHARGNIYNDDNGLGGVTPYGAKYL